MAELDALKGKTLIPGRCAHIMLGGKQCGQPVGELKYCLWHDPARVDEAEAARVRGGLMSTRKKYIRHTELPIGDLDNVLSDLEDVLVNLRDQPFTPQTANSMIRALQIKASCYLDREERDIIIKQIEELEKAVEELD